MKKEYKNGEIAHIGKNMRIKFSTNEGKIITKTIKNETEVTILNTEKIDEKCGKYAYYIECEVEGELLKSTHSISQNDFFSKVQWNKKLEFEELIKKLEKTK